MKKRHLIILVTLTLSIITLCALPLDPYTTRTDHILESPSVQFLLGTDDLGRDIFSRVLAGLRTSVGLSLGVVLVIAIVSLGAALVSVSSHKLFKIFLSFLVDIVHIMPIIVVCLVILASFGSGIHVLFVGQALAFLPLTMRVCLNEIDAVMQQDFAQTSRSLGMHPFFIALKHGMPFLVPKLCAQCISLTAVAIGIEGGLSYFGLGIPIPHPSLGTLLQDSRRYLTTHPLYFIVVTSVFLLLLLTLSVLNFVFFQKATWAVGHPHAPSHYIKTLQKS